MARKKVNKSQKIRELLETMGGQDASPSAVVAALKGKGIKVSAAQVSNVKAYAKQGANGRKASRKAAKSKGNLLSLADLQAAKRLVDQLGSVQAAQSAVGVLAKLR
ncbi:MAG: hypothetical protein AB7E74_09020 [Pirellulales bacterium]